MIFRFHVLERDVLVLVAPADLFGQQRNVDDAMPAERRIDRLCQVVQEVRGEGHTIAASLSITSIRLIRTIRFHDWTMRRRFHKGK